MLCALSSVLVAVAAQQCKERLLCHSEHHPQPNHIQANAGQGKRGAVSVRANAFSCCVYYYKTHKAHQLLD